jgi:hypothetical protein
LRHRENLNFIILITVPKNNSVGVISLMLHLNLNLFFRRRKCVCAHHSNRCISLSG